MAASVSHSTGLSRPIKRPSLIRLQPCSCQTTRVKCSSRSENDRTLTSPLDNLQSIAIGGAALLTPFLLDSGSALAVDREYGLLEGTSIALIHPAVMISLFGLTCYTGYLGWQWRSLRGVSGDIKSLKKQLPAVGEDGKRPESPLDEEIAQLEKIRKELAGANLRDRHYNYGTILLGGGISTAVFGALNTYLRTEKLFPGPHLFAGAGIVVLWALAASLVPSMQKGNEGARLAHIGLNTLNVLLFAWQLPTGFEIIGKVFEFTTFP